MCMKCSRSINAVFSFQVGLSQHDLLNEFFVYSSIRNMAPIGKVNLSGNGVDVEWRIEDFFSFTDTLNGYFSPDFSLGGQEWGIRIYPNGGWSGGKPTGYTDLIFIRRFTGRAIMQHISLSIKTVTGEKDHEHFEKLFEGWGTRGLGQKFLRFVSRSELLSRRSELVPNGVLTIVCSMKQTESAGSASKSCMRDERKCCVQDFHSLYFSKHFTPTISQYQSPPY